MATKKTNTLNKVKPIIVNDKNDPRLKAYNDSLGLFNGTPTTTNEDKKLQIVERTKQDYYSKENSYKNETGFNSDNGEMIPFSVNQPIGFVGFDDNSGVYPTYKKPVQPIIYKEPNHNKRKEINQLTPITNIQIPLDNTQPELKTVINNQPQKDSLKDIRKYSNNKGGYINEGRGEGRQEFKFGGKIDPIEIDPIEIAKGLKHGQTMEEFNSLSKIDKQRAIDAFDLLHAHSNIKFSDVDFKGAKTSIDSSDAISNYFNGRILGDNLNKNDSTKYNAMSKDFRRRNIGKGYMSSPNQKGYGGKLPKMSSGGGLNYANYGIEENDSALNPLKPISSTSVQIPTTSYNPQIKTTPTGTLNNTGSFNYEPYAKAGAAGLAGYAYGYNNTDGSKTDKNYAGLKTGISTGAASITPFYGAAATLGETGKSLISKETIVDRYGETKEVGTSGSGRFADTGFNFLYNQHSDLIDSVKHKDYKDTALQLASGGWSTFFTKPKRDKEDLSNYRAKIASEEEEKNRLEREKQEKFEKEQQLQYSKGYNIVNPTTGRENAGIYKYGGGLPKLVTGGNLIPVSSDTQKVVGASHEQGGVPIANKAGQPVAEVEGGESITDEKVFTDRVEVSPGITFAMMNEALGKKKGKFETKLASSDFREKNTAKREIQKIDSDINQLFELQGQKVQALGLDNGNTQDMPKASFGADLGKYASLLQYPYNANIIAKTPKIPKPVDDVNYNQVIMPMKTDYNINSALLNNESNFRKLNKNLDENTSNSATARGNKLAAFSKVLSSNNDLYTLKENTQTDLINKSNTNSQTVINNNIANKQDIDNANIAKINNYNVANMQRDSDINKMKTDNFASLTKNIGDISNYDQEKKVDFQQKMTILVNQSNAEEITRLSGTPLMDDILKSDKRNYDVVISKLKTLNDGGVALANFIKAHPR